MRLPDWKPRLIAYLDANVRRPFAPGRHDCALFVAGAVEAMTGNDPATLFRGRYRTLRGGQRILRSAGYGNHIDLAAALFGEMHPSQAAPGDLAVVPTEEGEALGLVQGEVVYVLTPTNVGLIPIATASRVFRVM